MKLTNPILKVFEKLTPEFLARPIVPLYVAFYFYILRFYFMPWLLGYGTMGMLSFPIDSDFAKELPRNPSGKILRRELRAPYWEGKDRNIS